MEKNKRCPVCGKQEYKVKPLAEPGTMLDLTDTEKAILAKVEKKVDKINDLKDQVDGLKEDIQKEMKQFWRMLEKRLNIRNKEHEMQISGDGTQVEYKGIHHDDYSQMNREVLEELIEMLQKAHEEQTKAMTPEEPELN